MKTHYAIAVGIGAFIAGGAPFKVSMLKQSGRLFHR